jgi:hypothetical protein
MRGRTLALLLAILLLTPALLVTSALADLRSPEGTGELGATLADDPAVQSLLVEVVVDAIVDDVVERSPGLAPLVPLVRPLLVQAATATVTSPAGRSAVSVALTDALRQVTLDGPIVIDLREAALAAAESVPPPLDTVVRAAVAGGVVGLVVLGEDHRIATEDVEPRDTGGRVAGIPGTVTVALVGLMLVSALAALLAPSDRPRRPRLLAAGAVLAILGALGTFAVRSAPDLLVSQVGTLADGDSAIVDALPSLIDGLAGLLGRTGALSVTLIGLGVLLLAAASLSAAGGPRPADRPA